MNTAYLAAIRGYNAVKSALAIVGLAALAAFSLPSHEREAMLSALSWKDAQESTTASPVAAGAIASPQRELDPEQRAVTEFIARRYRVSETAVSRFVATAYQAGERHAIDPLLVLAVMAVESRYNPVAKSGMGAKGLMQVMPRFHLEKLADYGGESALLEPDVNIAVGTRILREYMDRFRDTETALQMYAGALDEPTSQYAAKVFAEKARLEAFRKKATKPQSA